MKTLKTLKQALKVNKGQLTARDLLNSEIYTAKGWKTFKISADLKKDIVNNVVEILGGHNKTKESIKYNLLNTNINHWGLNRIIIEEKTLQSDKRKKVVSFRYIEGQNYEHELNQIRKYLK
jgi:hypothetical protein